PLICCGIRLRFIAPSKLKPTGGFGRPEPLINYKLRYSTPRMASAKAIAIIKAGLEARLELKARNFVMIFSFQIESGSLQG
ncbi:MAG: hypothetical protein AAB401_15875, partial [Acidobacteriota bacterium]